MAPGIHVLSVDDDPDIRELLATVLERTSDEFDVTTAESGREGLAILADVDIDCIVSDYQMPEMDGLEFFDAVRDRDPDVPFLLLTGTSRSEIATEAIDAGVTDYLRKGTVGGTAQYEVLANRIEHAVEKRRLERARAATDVPLERYRVLVENAVDPMYTLDENGTITMVNEAMADWTGYDRDRMLGSAIETFLSDETVDRATEALRRTLDSETPDADSFECTLEASDGSRQISETRVAPLRTDEGEFAGSVGVVREITEHRERQRELSQYETILQTAPFGLFVLDADATLVWMNDEYASGFSEPKDELLGMAFPTLVERGYYREVAIERYIEDVRTLLSSKNDRERATYNIHFRPASGEKQIYDVHTKLLPLEDGEFAGTVHALRDITQQQHYRHELERQNERLEEFATLVSHDLRNPLNVAQAHLDQLEERGNEQHIDELQWSLSRMTELVDGLLQLARQGKSIGEQAWVPIASVARDAWSTVDTGDARLELETGVEIYGDEARVRGLLENLFRNAVEHGSTSSRDSSRPDDAVEHGSTSPASNTQQDAVEHGSTSSRDGSRPDDAVEHGRDGTEQLVVTVGSLERERDGRSDRGTPPLDGFYVEDTGPGLPEDCESLFEFGYTTAADGTGLGLAIVEQIAEAHGWTVTASDGADGGARFEIRGVTVPTDEPDPVEPA